MSNILARCIERDAYMCSWRIKHQNSIVACSFFPLEKLFSRGSNESSSTPRWRRSIRQRENDLFSIENSNYLLSLVDQSTQLNVKRKTHPKRIFSQETYARISKIKKYHRSRFQYFFSLSRFFSPSANIFTGRRKKHRTAILKVIENNCDDQYVATHCFWPTIKLSKDILRAGIRLLARVLLHENDNFLARVLFCSRRTMMLW